VLAALDELRQYFTRLVATRMREPGDDLIGRIVGERVIPGELSAEHAASMVTGPAGT
jgi:cytochrome P450